MTRFGSHYQVARPTGQCAATGEPLPPGSPYVAALCERRDDEGFERVDYSIEAWEAGRRPPGLFSYWRSVVPEPDAPRKMLVDDEVLLDLFERLAEDQRPQRVAFRFVLGLILMRKKHLKLLGRKTVEGADIWLLGLRGARPPVPAPPAAAGPEPPPIELLNPHLSDDDVQELTAQLGEILQGEL